MRPLQASHELINFASRRVDVKAGAGGCTQLHFAMQWHGTMVPGPDSHPILIQQLGNIMRVQAFQGKGSHTAPLFCLMGANQL